MKLTVFNGSPRGKKSNSKMIIESFLNGFEAVENNSFETHFLIRTEEQEIFKKAFQDAEAVLMVFPLYTDCMPGIVKTFIETLEPLCGAENNPPIAFIIHSGFPEGIHMRALEKYLNKLARRLGCRYIGTVVKGSSESLQHSTEEYQRSWLKSCYALGENFAQTGQFDEQMLKTMAQPEQFPGWISIFFNLVSRTPLMTGFWDKEMKKNGVYKQRFAKPYEN